MKQKDLWKEIVKMQFFFSAPNYVIISAEQKFFLINFLIKAKEIYMWHGLYLTFCKKM
jgi:hypothetical protein